MIFDSNVGDMPDRKSENIMIVGPHDKRDWLEHRECTDENPTFALMQSAFVNQWDHIETPFAGNYDGGYNQADRGYSGGHHEIHSGGNSGGHHDYGGNSGGGDNGGY